MIRTGSPKKLGYHFLELEAFIRSNNALGIYILDGEVPETFMKRQASDDRMLRYNCLPHALSYDILSSGSFSKCGNKYAQMHGAYFGWARAFPMENKGDTHETLSLLFKCDGVPP